VKYKVVLDEASQYEYPITFQASVWLYNEDDDYPNPIYCSLNGPGTASATSTFRAGNWLLRSREFTVNSASELVFSVYNSGSESIYIDDFRVSPFNAAVSSYTYDKSGNVTAILNNNNFATKYTYDAAGRLVKTEKETEKGFEKVSAYQYNFAGRFSVSPNTQQDYGYQGVEDVRFEFIKSSGVYLMVNVSVPSWMGGVSVNNSNGYFTVDVQANTGCGVRSGNIVITTNPATETITIPVTQEAQPSISNVNLLNACDEQLTTNEIYIGQPYKIIYTDCQEPGNHIVNYKVYGYEGGTRTLVHHINDPDQEIDWHAYGEHSYFWNEVPNTPNILSQWYGNFNYVICVENASNPEVYYETTPLRIISGPSCLPEEPLEFYFTNDVPSPFEMTNTLNQTYTHTLTWYKSSTANCSDVHLYLEVWENESMYRKMLNDIYLPTSIGPFSGIVTNQNSYTWSFNPWDFEAAIENTGNHSSDFIEKDEYVYSIRIDGSGTGCVARTNLFYIEGLYFNF